MARMGVEAAPGGCTGANVTQPCLRQRGPQVAWKRGAWTAGPGAREGGRSEGVQGRPWRGDWHLRGPGGR